MGTMAATVLQSVLNVAIVAMVNEEVWTQDTVTSDECLGSFSGNSTSRMITGEFYWDPYTQGNLLGANSYGTLFTHFLGGFVSARYGGKWIFGGGILVEAIFSCLTPISARAGVVYLFLVRFMFGLAEGVIGPASVSLIARWAPRSQRGTFIGLSISGVYLGNAIISSLTGFVSSREYLGGWPTVFYLTGGIGCVWFLFWSVLTYSSPELHPRITDEELSYIKDSQETSQRPPKVPWKAIAFSAPFWSINVLSFSYLWLLATFNTGMPLYLETVMRVPIEFNGLIIGLVYPANIVGSLLGGFFADFIRKKSTMSITTIRKIFCSTAFLCGTFCFLCIPIVGCDLAIVFVSMFMTKLLFTLNAGGSSVVLVDMAPEYAGVLNGLVSTVTAATGFLSPLLTGTIINNDVTRGRWSLVFLISAAMAIFGLFTFLCLGSAEIQPWAIQRSDSKDKPNKDTESLEKSPLLSKEERFHASTCSSLDPTQVL